MAALQEPLREPISGSGSVKIGPFLSVTDGKTPMTTLTINRADVRLSKDNGAFLQKHESTAATADGTTGWYDVELDGTDLSYGGYFYGQLLIAVNMEGALPVWRKFAVEVPAP